MAVLEYLLHGPARREYTCDACKRTITRGERYNRVCAYLPSRGTVKRKVYERWIYCLNHPDPTEDSVSDSYRLSIELPLCTYRLEQQYLTEAEARIEAETVYKQNDGLIRTVGLFLYRYSHQHDPKLIDVYDGSWSSEWPEEVA